MHIFAKKDMRFEKRQLLIGDTRWIRKFAWLPKQVGKMGTTVWLERYVSQQVYDMWKVPGPGYKGTRTIFGWREIAAWVWGGRELRLSQIDNIKTQ